MKSNVQSKCCICSKTGIYKCPTCFIYYCSVECCQKHRKQECNLIVKKEENEIPKKKKKLDEDDDNNDDVLDLNVESLKGNPDIKKILSDPYLRNLLKTIDKADNPNEIMEKAMFSPLFVEFADVCLQIVRPEEA